MTIEEAEVTIIKEAEARIKDSNFRFYGGYGKEIQTIIEAIKNGYILVKEANDNEK